MDSIKHAKTLSKNEVKTVLDKNLKIMNILLKIRKNF